MILSPIKGILERRLFMSERKHIYIPEDISLKIQEYADKSGIKYSQAVAKLVEYGLSNLEISRSINSYVGVMDRIYSKLCYNSSLLEQFYSDMEIEKLSNPNHNTALQKFRNKHSKYSIDD